MSVSRAAAPQGPALAISALTAQATPGSPLVDFSGDHGGWRAEFGENAPELGWNTWVDTSMGNGSALHSLMSETQGPAWTNQSTGLTGDWSNSGLIKFSFDVNIISFINLELGNEVERELVVELRSFTHTGTEYAPYSSIWTPVGTAGAGMGWQSFSAVLDTNATSLPAGWFVGNSLDGTTFPDGVTFTEILKSVGEVRISTVSGDIGYGMAQVDVAIDNIAVSAVPEPTTTASMALGLCTLVGLARRRRKSS